MLLRFPDRLLCRGEFFSVVSISTLSPYGSVVHVVKRTTNTYHGADIQLAGLAYRIVGRAAHSLAFVVVGAAAAAAA